MHKHYDLVERRYHMVDGVRVRRPWAISCEGPSIVQKHQAAETDINVIVERFKVTGMAPQRLEALNLGAFDDIFDYRTAMDAVVAADRAFGLVPAEIRSRFNNDPQRFAEFCTNPENTDELIRLKLASARPKVEPVIQKVEVVNGPGSSIPPSGVPPKA